MATHLLHCVQMFSSSQIGMNWAMPLFSYWVVPVGKVPSTGTALRARSAGQEGEQDSGGHRDAAHNDEGDRPTTQILTRMPEGDAA